jgi:hypothetical protein
MLKFNECVSNTHYYAIFNKFYKGIDQNNKLKKLSTFQDKLTNFSGTLFYQKIFISQLIIT